MRVYTTQLSGITTQFNIALKLTHSPLSYAFLLQGQLANCTMALQRFDEARQILKEPQMLKAPGDYTVHNIHYALAFLASDSAEMTKQQEWFASNPQFGQGLQVGLKAKTRYL